MISEDSANTKGDEEYISDGSIIAVADGTCALVVENGKVHSVFFETGENIFRSDKSVGIFSEKSGGVVKSIFEDAARRFTFGGDIIPVNHRVYYVNTKENTGNTFCANDILRRRNFVFAQNVVQKLWGIIVKNVVKSDMI